LSAMVAEFRLCAGPAASFQEFETHLRYEGDVFVGAVFTPEPFWKTVRRTAKVLVFQVAAAATIAFLWALVWVGYFWACKGPWIVLDVSRRIVVALCIIATMLFAAEGSFREALYRLKTTWPFFALLFILHVGAGAVFFNVEALRPYRIIIAGCFYEYVGIVLPVIVFRQVALTSRTVVRKRLYVIQMGLVFFLLVTFSFSARSFFFPLVRDIARGRGIIKKNCDHDLVAHHFPSSCTPDGAGPLIARRSCAAIRGPDLVSGGSFRFLPKDDAGQDGACVLSAKRCMQTARFGHFFLISVSMSSLRF